jgi:hypothetical protein
VICKWVRVTLEKVLTSSLAPNPSLTAWFSTTLLPSYAPPTGLLR